MAINPKSHVVRRGKKMWKNVVHTAKMLPYEVEKRWPGETTGGRRTGPVVSDRHPGVDGWESVAWLVEEGGGCKLGGKLAM